MLLRLSVKGCLKPWTADLGRLKQIITIFQDKSKKGKSSGIPTLQIVRFPRLVYYRNHERSDVIHFTLSGTVDCFTLRVCSFECFIFFFEIARPQAAAIHSQFGILSKSRTKWRDPFHVVWYMDCFTLRVRSFECFISFSKLRGRRPRQSIPRLVYYRNREWSDVIHFTSSGIWTASHFVFAVSSVLFSFPRPTQKAASHFMFAVSK